MMTTWPPSCGIGMKRPLPACAISRHTRSVSGASPASKALTTMSFWFATDSVTGYLVSGALLQVHQIGIEVLDVGVQFEVLGDVFVADVGIGDEAHADIGVRIGIDDCGRDRPDFSFCPLDQATHRAGGIKNEGDFDGRLCDGGRHTGGKGCGESEDKSADTDAWHRGSPPVFCPSEPRFHRLHGPVRSKTRRPRYEFAAELAPTVHVRQAGNRLGSGKGIARPPDQPRARAGSPPVGDGAGDRARHRAAVTVARV